MKRFLNALFVLALIAGCSSLEKKQEEPKIEKVELTEGQLLQLEIDKKEELRKLTTNIDWNKIQWPKVIDVASEVINFDPYYTDAYANRGDAYEQLSKYDKAIDSWLKVFELDNNRGYALTHVALCYERKGDLKKADEFFLKAISVIPVSWWCLEIYANSLNGRRDYEKAIEYYTKSFELHTDINPWCIAIRGSAYKNIGKNSEALVDYNTALKKYQEINDINSISWVNDLIKEIQ